MTQQVEVRPSNSIVVISEPGRGKVPSSFAGEIFAATSSAIAVGCRSEADGPTALILGSSNEFEALGPPAFTAIISTPVRVVAIHTVRNERLLELPVDTDDTVIKVWVNDLSEPDRIVVGIG